MDEDEEMLYREMNEEDPFYMGDIDDEEDAWDNREEIYEEQSYEEIPERKSTSYISENKVYPRAGINRNSHIKRQHEIYIRQQELRQKRSEEGKRERREKEKKGKTYQLFKIITAILILLFLLFIIL